MDNLEEENKKQKKIILFFFLISILFHGLLVLFFYVVPKYAKTPEVPKETQVLWVDPQLPKNFDIADIERPPVEKRPTKAKFVGQYDSSPPEEIVARPKPKPKIMKENPFSSVEPEKVASKSAKSQEAQKASEEKIEKKVVKKENPSKTPKAVEGEAATQAPVKDFSDFSLKPEDVKPPSSHSSPKDFSFKSSGSGLSLGRPTSPDLFAHDYYPDYKIGGKTYLNVMKLQDVSYFVRMKRILKMRWNPVPPIERYMMSNRLTAGKVECVVGLSLDSTGNIAEMFMIRSSGLGAYDQEAVQTIRDSSPFAAPPSDYVKDGRLNMSWTFTVYL